MVYEDEKQDFNNWCANYFGPDSDEQYVLDAVRKCPIVERLQSRLESLEKKVKFSDMIRNDDLRREAVTLAMNEGFKSQDELLSKLSLEKDAARLKVILDAQDSGDEESRFAVIKNAHFDCYQSSQELVDAIDTAMQANKGE